MLNNKPQWTRIKPTLAGWYFWRHHSDDIAIVNMVLVRYWNNSHPTAEFMVPGCETRHENLTNFSGGEWLGPIGPETQRTPRDTEVYDLADEIMKRHNEQLRVYGHDTTLKGRLNHILNEYETTAINALNDAKSFRDDLLVDFRAVSMVLAMVANAATHKEKDSRLRGCMELIETVVSRLQKENFDIAICERPTFHNPFVSDFPSRKFIERIHALEEENKALKANQMPAETDEKIPEALL